MKYLQTYEGFFDFFKNKKRRAGDGIYYWLEYEIEKMESLGFSRRSAVPMNTVPFYYEPLNSDIINIIVEKLADINYATSDEDWFYNVTIVYNNDKEQYKDFDNFNDMIEYVKQFVKKIDIDSKKYNI